MASINFYAKGHDMSLRYELAKADLYKTLVDLYVSWDNTKMLLIIANRVPKDTN